MSIYQNDPKIRSEIDRLLSKIAGVEANLGIDSTKQQFTKAKSKQNDLMEKIKVLDIEFYNVINP